MDIDLYRRNLQRSYVDMLSATLKNPAGNSDLPAYARAESEAIRAMIDRTNAWQIKPVARIHFKDLTARISRALDPRLPIEQARFCSSFKHGHNFHIRIDQQGIYIDAGYCFRMERIRGSAATRDDNIRHGFERWPPRKWNEINKGEQGDRTKSVF
ncbi:MAG TPA: hypothetical protein VH595_22975 [Verrucomicrobiae bacterium]|nr:hypothetical protein [Verrucomicrobiae bacterium]